MVAEIEFLQHNGARRVTGYIGPPLTLGDDGRAEGEEPNEETVDLGIEEPPERWRPRNVLGESVPTRWPYRPVQFIDGKDVGQTVAWLPSRAGFPVPIRLAQIGSVIVRDNNHRLQRCFANVEHVVSMAADLFPWHEVEGFARSLVGKGFRLLSCSRPNDGWSYDYERMRKVTQNRSMEEMTRLEKQALRAAGDLPTLVDGRLEPRAGAFDHQQSPVVGMIKTLRHIPLHPQGWRVFYALEPGQRTPAFCLKQRNLSVVTWFLRLAGENGILPNWGVVRLELSDGFFRHQLGGNPGQLDCYSRLIYDFRTRDSGYARAPVSIYPVQRAEESLGALFVDSNYLNNHFYRLTGL